MKGNKKAIQASEYNKEKFASHKAWEANKPYIIKVSRMLEQLKNKQNMKLLDVGCADGSFGLKMSSLGFKVRGIDISEGAVKIARSKGLNARVHDISRKFPFSSDEFDVVVCMEVIEHIYDTDFLLEEIYRVLKPGGLLMLTTPNLASAVNRVRLLWGKQPYLSEYRLGGENSGHIRNYTKGAMVTQLRDHGFVVRRVVAPNVPFPMSHSFPAVLKRVFMSLGNFRFFGATGHLLIVAAIKKR